MVDDPAQDGAMAFWDDIRACEGVVELLPLLSAKYTCAVASNAADSDSGLMKKAFERVGLAEIAVSFDGKTATVETPAAFKANGTAPRGIVLDGKYVLAE